MALSSWGELEADIASIGFSCKLSMLMLHAKHSMEPNLWKQFKLLKPFCKFYILSLKSEIVLFFFCINWDLSFFLLDFFIIFGKVVLWG